MIKAGFPNGPGAASVFGLDGTGEREPKARVSVVKLFDPSKLEALETDWQLGDNCPEDP